MNAKARLATHGALLLVAASAALYMWTRDKTVEGKATTGVVVWSGRPAEVQRIEYESSTRKVLLEARQGPDGMWYEGTAEKELAVIGQPDAGPPPEPQRTTVRIVSVKAGNRIAETLAPMRAIRELGVVPESKAEDFGFKQPSGTLTVTIDGKTHKLTIGGLTFGGGDRYARDESGKVYAIDGKLIRDLDAGEAALNERMLHGFEHDEVQRVRITSQGKSTEVLRRGPEGKKFWAVATAPDQPDEEATTYMAKVDRLHPTEYLKEPGQPVRDDHLVVKLSYEGASGSLGFVELFKLPGEDDKAKYLIRTERTHGFATVYPTSGEQVETSSASFVK